MTIDSVKKMKDALCEKLKVSFGSTVEEASDAQMMRGTGDKEAITTYANAFNKDKDFYGFMRSMEAYRNTLADPETRLILSPGSDFFRYFQDHTSGPASSP